MIFCIAKNSALYTFYKLNTDAFVALFCENKAKPLLKCNGKCQLTKMAKEEQKEAADKVLLNMQKEVFWFYQSSQIINASTLFTVPKTTVIRIATNHYSYLYFFRDDKPPQFLS